VYFRWLGGKSKLVKTILELMPRHNIYVEPFIGAGWVFWNKRPATTEVINDLDTRLIKFYQSLRDIEDLKAVVDKYGWAYGITETESRKLFDKAKKIIELDANKELTTIEDKEQYVWAFLYVNKFAYAGRMVDSTFNTRRIRDCTSPYCGIKTLLKDFEKVKRRLRNTVIMNEDWTVPTLQYDSKETFFYFDPPYVGTTDNSFTETDYKTRNMAPRPSKIFRVISKLEGKFLLSYDYHPTVLKYIDKYGLYYTVVELEYEVRKNDNNKVVKEVIVSNFDLKKQKSLSDFLKL